MGGGVSPAGGLCADFCWLLQEAAERVGMRLLAYCLMPNHWSQEGRHGLGLGKDFEGLLGNDTAQVTQPTPMQTARLIQ